MLLKFCSNWEGCFLFCLVGYLSLVYDELEAKVAGLTVVAGTT